MLRQSWRSWFGASFERVGPWWLQYVWTFGFCMAVAVGFTILSFMFYNGDSGPWGTMRRWWHWYQLNLMISLCVGYSIHLVMEASQRLIGNDRVRAFSPRTKSLFFSLVPLVGAAIGWPLGLMWALGVDLRRWFGLMPANAIVASVLVGALIAFISHQFFAIKARQFEAEKCAAEAHLKLLQGQIEPHFLFNTLANVVSLIDVNAPRAKAMLESFIDYLRSSLRGLRDERHKLGEEIDLIDAYLRVIAIRMEDRLHYAIDVPEALRARALPALTLQPLVENAVLHGLEPKIDGGRVQVVARETGGVLTLTVEDDGLGLDAARPARPSRPGTGTALDNIRERLLHAFGGAAALNVEPGASAGVRASLVIPSAAC